MKRQKISRIIKKEFKWIFIRIFPLIIGNIILFRWFSLEYFSIDLYNIALRVWTAGYILVGAAAINRYLLGIFHKSISGVIKHYSDEGSKKRQLKTTSTLTSFFRIGVYATAFLLCINLFVDLQQIWDVIGTTFGLVVTFMIGLLTSSILGNVIAFEALRQSDTANVNEVVETKDNLFGTVVSRGPFFTRIRTPDKEIVSVSNLDVTNNLLRNYSRESPIIISVKVGLGYDIKKKIAKNMLLEAARKTEDVLSNPEPYVLFIELGDFSITYNLKAYIDQPHNLIQIKSQLIENIIDTFDENNMEILSPHHTAMRFNDPKIADTFRKPK
ncbi:mechanosensitive ion channel family protein [Thermoproteota archaeon]